MAKFYNKISNLITSQVPDFVLEDHPKFVQFLKSYYTFMESAELTVEGTERTDGIQLETETNQENTLILDASKIDGDRTPLDAGDKIILESSVYGKFTRGETIRGGTSKATAIVLAEDLINNRLFISAQDKFIMGETIIGLSSSATTVISNYKPNPVNTIQDLLNFRDPDKAISNFLTKFRNEFLNTIPEELNININKRNLIKNIKSLYRLKGTNTGHQIFFRMLFGLESETTYPREQILRVSDGKWNTSKILRVISTEGNTVDLIGRTIEGQTSDATAVIENVFKFQIGSDEVSELIINSDSVTGTFSVSEEIRGTSSNDSDVFIKATISGIPSLPTITNDGSLYTEGDTVAITSGGEGAIIQVDGVGRGGITEFFIDDVGTGYSIGDDLVFTNTNTGGGAATAKVSVVNGGFTDEESTSSINDHIVLEDETVRGDSYTGNKLVQESGTGVGDITDIRIINAGSNYISLPTVTITSTGGSGAVVRVYGSDIGRVQSLKIVEPGKGYENSPTPPSLKLPAYLLLVDRSGPFSTSETVSATGSDGSTTITATVVALNTSTNILEVSNASGTFGTDVTITGSISGATATIKKFDQATATTTVTALLDTAGVYINQDGHVSENAMKIQDSLLYQDFSYIIKVGRSINDWRDSFKKTMHSAGFYIQGQVNIATQVSAELRSVTGINSGEINTPIDSVINTLFTTIFGRRLGTIDDGTTLRASPQTGEGADYNTSTTSPFSIGTRDVTLKRQYRVSFPAIARISVRGDELKFGYAYCGPRMKSLRLNSTNQAFTSMFGGNHPNVQTGPGGADSVVRKYVQPMLLQDWANHRLTGLNNTSYDGEVVQIQDLANNNLKTNITYPTEISVSY
jgi:hypothetical protein